VPSWDPFETIQEATSARSLNYLLARLLDINEPPRVRPNDLQAYAKTKTGVKARREREGRGKKKNIVRYTISSTSGPKS